MLTVNERSKKTKDLGILENELIQEIANTNNNNLMNMFLDWQSLRQTLNEDLLQKLEDSLSITRKG